MVDIDSPAADAGPPWIRAIVDVVGHSDDGPLQMPERRPDAVHEALAEAVLRFVPEGAQSNTVRDHSARRCWTDDGALRIDTGLLTDAVVDLDLRGMLIGTPSATYLLGTSSSTTGPTESTSCAARVHA